MPLPPQNELDAIVRDQVEVRRHSVGMVVGVVSAEGRRVAAHGVFEYGGQRPVRTGTVFELASVTKIFPSVLLAQMVRAGEVRLVDPVETLLPADVRVPERKGRQITLVDLATHTSGLPPKPEDFPTLDHLEGAAYSREQLYRAVSACQLTRDIGSKWEYGNLDTALLGHALAHRLGTDFDSLVAERITGPLRMTSTATEPSPSTAGQLSSSHDSDRRPKPRLALGALAPAGGMLSNADDLLTLAGALLDLTPSPLAGLLPSMLQTRRSIRPSMATMLRENWRLMLRMIFRPPPAAAPPLRYFTRAEGAIGWFVLGRGREELVVHDGAGPSCAASLALDPKSRSAVVVLSNTGRSVHDIARHVLWRDYPLSAIRREVAVDPKVLDRYVGRYQPQRGVLFDVRRDGERLSVGMPVIGRLPLRAESDHEFFVPEMGFEFRFHGPADEMSFRPTVASPLMPVHKLPA